MTLGDVDAIAYKLALAVELQMSLGWGDGSSINKIGVEIDAPAGYLCSLSGSTSTTTMNVQANGQFSQIPKIPEGIPFLLRFGIVRATGGGYCFIGGQSLLVKPLPDIPPNRLAIHAQQNALTIDYVIVYAADRTPM